MSPADLAAAAPAPAGPAPDGPAPAGRAGHSAGAWFRFLRAELRMVFWRPRDLALLGVVAVLPVCLGIVLKVSAPGPAGGGPPFVNQVASNGVVLALAAIGLMLTVILPLTIAVVSGDAIAGEAGRGTLRGLLTVPAGRTRLLTVKCASIAIFCLAACLLAALTALLAGVVLFPVGPVTLLSGTSISLAAGLLRVLAVAVYAAVALAALGAIGLAISTLTEHAVGAIATILVLVIASEIADSVQQIAAIHPYLPTHYWLSWDGLLRAPVGWGGIEHGLLSFAVYLVIFGSIAWARLGSADITS